MQAPAGFVRRADVRKLEERIVSVDAARRTLSYTVERGLPVNHYEGELHVHEPAPGTAEVVWTVRFEGPANAVEQVEAMVKEVCPAGLRGLGEYRLRSVA